MPLRTPYDLPDSDIPPKQAVSPAFEAWAIVEIFGHKRTVG